MIHFIDLKVAKERIGTMSDAQLGQACTETMRLRDFSMLDVANPDDVEELFALLGLEVEKRKLYQRPMPRDPLSRTRKTD